MGRKKLLIAALMCPLSLFMRSVASRFFVVVVVTDSIFPFVFQSFALFTSSRDEQADG